MRTDADVIFLLFLHIRRSIIPNNSRITSAYVRRGAKWPTSNYLGADVTSATPAPGGRRCLTGLSGFHGGSRVRQHAGPATRQTRHLIRPSGPLCMGFIRGFL